MAAGLDQVQPGSVQRIRSLAVALFRLSEWTQQTKRHRRLFVGAKAHGEMLAAARARRQAASKTFKHINQLQNRPTKQ